MLMYAFTCKVFLYYATVVKVLRSLYFELVFQRRPLLCSPVELSHMDPHLSEDGNIVEKAKALVSLYTKMELTKLTNC